MQKTAEALAEAAEDLFGFGAVCAGGDAQLAETSVSNAFLEGWEQGWFSWDDGVPRYAESRAKFYRALWEEWRHRGRNAEVAGAWRSFFLLPPEMRAALFLRHKRKCSVSAIGFVLDVADDEVRRLLQEGRTLLLGRAPVEVEEL
ncbi:MAG: hypothetical protein HUU37_08530 [Bdellovibrionales bacterium]|nr:hypothetical protein [Bdellovibrionales bacterium]